MLRDDPKYKQLIAFIDLVFNIMMAFAFLFILAFALMNIQDSKKTKIDSKAEALITMTWPDNAVEDLDLWMLLPGGKYVSFKNTNTDLANIERDDRGMYGDYITTLEGRTVRNPVNKEVITLRGLTPGKYTVAMHFYSGMSGMDGMMGQLTAEERAQIPKTPYKVQVQLVKLNPTYREIVTVELVAQHPGSETTAFSFTITDSGEIINIDRTERLFVNTSVSRDY